MNHRIGLSDIMFIKVNLFIIEIYKVQAIDSGGI